MVLDSVDGKFDVLKKAKKSERDTGRRLVKNLHTTGSDAKAAGSQKTTHRRIEDQKGQQRNKLNHLLGKSCEEKRNMTRLEELLCVCV